MQVCDMSQKEILYTDIPPTKLRNRAEKFREPESIPFWCWVADQFFFRMIENRFFALRIKGEENYQKRNPKYANVIYAPHSNWWDGIVGYNVCKRIFNTNIRMMIEEMNRFPIFAKAGAYPVNKKSPQAAMKSLQYTIKMLKDETLSLWLFPQGIIRPPNYRPIEFQTGISYITDNCVKHNGGINLIPVSVSYAFLREDKPEVLVEVGEPTVYESFDSTRKEFTHKLQDDFTAFCDKQLADIASGEIDGYRVLFKQKLPWYKKLEKRLKNIEMPGSGF